MTTPKMCKKCGKEVGDQHSEIGKNREIVIVDEQVEQALILNKGDCLCPACSAVVTYYRRVR